MKIKGATEKWAIGALGLVCLLLVMNMVRGGSPAAQEKRNTPPGPAPETRQTRAVPPDAKDELSRYNPEIKLDLLSDIQQRELPTFARNPFEFPKPKELPLPVGPSLPTATANNTPPPTPTLPIRMLGYSEKAGGMKEGIVEDDEGIYVVHVGETFNKRYKVNKLVTTSASIYDEVTHQTVELPIPQ
jgi:hypothetical protein